jgi:hypothetical protein
MDSFAKAGRGSAISDIFISYATDDRARAEILAAALEQQGWSVWWDRKIPPGKAFDEVISEALNGARCVIVLWSAVSVKSNWVKEEAGRAVNRNLFLPALIDEVEIPLGFGRFQAARLIEWYQQSNAAELQSLLDSVRSMLQTEPSPAPPPRKPPSTAPRAAAGLVPKAAGSPKTAKWHAELLSKSHTERRVALHLSDRHVIEFKYRPTGVLKNHIVKVDGEVVYEGGHGFTFTIRSDFEIADGGQRYPVTIEGKTTLIESIGRFCISVAGQRVYEET